MASPNRSVEVYDVRLQRASQPHRDCKFFHDFVRRKAETGRQMLKFSIIAEAATCEVELQVRCESCGTFSLNRFRRDIVLKFPNVVFVRFIRQR